MAKATTPTQADMDQAAEEIRLLTAQRDTLAGALGAMNAAFDTLKNAGTTAAADALEKAEERKNALEEAKDQYANYADYNRLLRSWFVAFGIGGIALFFTRPELMSGMASWVMWTIIVAFLFGAAGQVIVAFLNKIASYHNYSYEHGVATADPGVAVPVKSPREKWWEKVSEKFWIDIFADCVSGVLFGYVVVMLLVRAALATPQPPVFL